MVNTLVQAENASSHGFMSALMREGKALVHAMWFDVRSGDLLYFSRREKVGNNGRHSTYRVTRLLGNNLLLT